MSVWVSLFMQFLFPSECWGEGNFLNQIVSSDWRPGNWGRVWKRGKSKEEESFPLEWLPKRNRGSMAAETPASYLCRWAWNTACTNLCTVQTHGHTNTHPPIRVYVVWDEQVNSFEREFVPFFFFSLHYTLKLLSVIKQTEKIVFQKPCIRLFYQVL